MQRRRRGKQNTIESNRIPANVYGTSFVPQEENKQKYGYLPQDDQTRMWQNDNATRVINTNEYSNISNDSIDNNLYTNYNDNSNYYIDETAYVNDYEYTGNQPFAEYDPEEDEVYLRELKRERWKLIYFFINLLGTIIGLLLIFLLLAVIFNLLAWAKSDMFKIFSFLGLR